MRHEPTGPGGAGSISYEPHGEIGLLRDPRAWALLLAGMLTVMSNSTIAPALPGPSVKAVPDGDNRERLICPDCGYIEYENPKIVVGAVCTWQEQFLLCR